MGRGRPGAWRADHFGRAHQLPQLGLTDRECRLCFGLALWNGKDPILKERLFGLTGPEGNHGEDVKESYFYLNNTPTHSYARALYKYPQCEYPYSCVPWRGDWHASRVNTAAKQRGSLTRTARVAATIANASSKVTLRVWAQRALLIW